MNDNTNKNLILFDCQLSIKTANNYVINVDTNVNDSFKGAKLYLQSTDLETNSKWSFEFRTIQLDGGGKIEGYIIYNMNDQEKNVVTFMDYDKVLTLQPFSNQQTQLWSVYATSENTYIINSMNDVREVISTRNREIVPGTEIITFNNNNDTTQNWVPLFSRKPAEGLQEGTYSIQTLLNTDFAMKAKDDYIQFDKAYNLQDREFELIWLPNIKAYSIRLVETNQSLSYDEEKNVILKPFNNNDTTQIWNIYKADNNQYIIESISEPTYVMDIKGAAYQTENLILYPKKAEYSPNQLWKFGNSRLFPSTDYIKNSHKFYDWITIKPGEFQLQFRSIPDVIYEVITEYVVRIDSGEAFSVNKPKRESNGTVIIPYVFNKGVIQIDVNLINDTTCTVFKKAIPLRSLPVDEDGHYHEGLHSININYYNSTCNIYYTNKGFYK
ncbi:hypothetical protein OCE56_24695 [Bacillus cereus]|nr:hypothetical protein [Bacillus cereus]